MLGFLNLWWSVAIIYQVQVDILSIILIIPSHCNNTSNIIYKINVNSSFDNTTKMKEERLWCSFSLPIDLPTGYSPDCNQIRVWLLLGSLFFKVDHLPIKSATYEGTLLCQNIFQTSYHDLKPTNQSFQIMT